MSGLPDLESLRCFVVAARELNFRAASEVVALSPAAFSDRISRLEADLGGRLFVRTTRSVQLSPAGHRLLPQAQRIIADAGKLSALVTDEGAVPNVVLNVGTRFELGMSWLVPSLGALEDARPGRTLHVVFGDSPDLMRSLEIGRIDCVVTSLRLTRPGLDYCTLAPEHYVFVGSPDLVSERPFNEPADAASHTLVDTLPNLPLFRYFLDATTGPAAWSFAATRYMGAIAAVRALVLEGMGVGVLPRYFVAEDLEAGRLVSLMPDVQPNHDYFRLVWRADHVLSDELRQLGEDMLAHPLR